MNTRSALDTTATATSTPKIRQIARIAAMTGIAMIVLTAMTACNDTPGVDDSNDLANAIAGSEQASMLVNEVPAQADITTTITPASSESFNAPEGNTPVAYTGGDTPATPNLLGTDVTTLTPSGEMPPADVEPVSAVPLETSDSSEFEAEPEPETAVPEPEPEIAPIDAEPVTDEAPTPVPVPEPVEGDAGMTGDALAMAHEIFDCYNEWRASQGLGRAVWDGRCCEMAMASARGCESQRKLVHRLGIPSDLQNSHSDILQYASWRMSGNEAVARWANSHGHAAQMRCATAHTAACAVYESNGIYWIAIMYTFENCNIG